MSKKDVLAKSHWESYPFKIEMLAEKPKNNGELTPEDAAKLEGTLHTHSYGSIETGMQLRWYWVLDAQKRIVACRYKLFGSPALRAAADMAALLCRNKSLEEAAKINYKSLEYFLRDHPSNPALPPEKQYEILFVLEAITATIKRIEGEEPGASEIVCECAGVNREQIEKAIRDFDLNSIEAITDYTRAGAFCKSCIAPGRGMADRSLYLVDLLKEIRKAMEEEKKASGISLEDKPFKEMSLEGKRAAIEKTIDDHIRAMLVMDGGDMEILDIKENGKHTDIYIRYLGACSGCASASTGTLFAIEGILKQKLDPDIRVLPL
ncbi:NifU family protein [Nitratifractor sp.]|uniref:NifU family protein n=1 Tax=Nitratifractor sp. TaxID=2268144 RepID=UPI0025F560B1|nr:NifU family protein [Nitratifractor sp.]